MADYINGHDLDDEAPTPRRRFRLFDSQREGRGVSKEDARITPDLGGFFRSFGRNFTKLLSVNILTLVGNFPLLFAILALSGLFKVQYMQPVSGYFADLHATMLSGGVQDPATMALFGVIGPHVENSAMTTTSYVLFGLSALTLFTFGLTKVGTTYILRSLVRGEPVFMLTDFKYAAKRNLRQALPMGIIDLVALCLFPLNVFILLQTGGTLIESIFLWTNVAIALIYFFMRPYIYLQIVTFDLKLTKIIKNALIFSLLGFKRNLLAFLGFVILVLLVFVLIFGLGGALMPIGLALPLVLLFSASSFMGTFAAWFKIKDVMIGSEEGDAQEA